MLSYSLGQKCQEKRNRDTVQDKKSPTNERICADVLMILPVHFSATANLHDIGLLPSYSAPHVGQGVEKRSH